MNVLLSPSPSSFNQSNECPQVEHRLQKDPRNIRANNIVGLHRRNAGSRVGGWGDLAIFGGTLPQTQGIQHRACNVPLSTDPSTRRVCPMICSRAIMLTLLSLHPIPIPLDYPPPPPPPASGNKTNHPIYSILLSILSLCVPVFSPLTYPSSRNSPRHIILILSHSHTHTHTHIYTYIYT